MFELVLPIAGVSINLVIVASTGLLIGFVSGLFGVGGGFLMTPILIFLGVPTPYAVATGSVQLVASSTFSTIVAARQRMIDLKLSAYLISGAVAGTIIGIGAFNTLNKLGQLDTFISISYVLLLGSIGLLMLKESITSFQKLEGQTEKIPSDNFLYRWFSTFKIQRDFPNLGTTISLIPLVLVSALIGIMGTILGVGGGFMFVPALIYFFGLSTRSAVAASQVQILVTMVLATLLHAIFSHTIDAVLAAPLILGGVIGAHFGTFAGRFINGARFRFALALLILSVAIRFFVGFLIFPTTDHFGAMELDGRTNLPAWEQWLIFQASNNGPFYGLSAAFAAIACGYIGTSFFDRDR
jgi:uncharacterized protein